MFSIVTINVPVDRDTVKSVESNPGARPRPHWVGQLTSSRFRRLSREFLWIVLGKVAAVAGAVVGVRLLTELLNQTIYGQLGLGMTVATLIWQLVLGPISNGATRFYAPACEVKALHRHISVVKELLCKATAGIMIASILLCLGLLLAGESRWIALAVAAICFAVLSGYNSVLSGMQNAARQRAIVALHQGLASWGRFLMAAAMVWWLGPSSAVAMLGYALAIVLVLSSQWWFFLRALRRENAPSVATDVPDEQWRSQIVAYAWPFATWSLLGWAALAADRWSLQMFTSSYEVGLYAVLFQLGFYPITMLTAMGTQLLAPIYFQRVGDASDPARVLKVYALGRRITMLAVLCTLLMAVVCLIFHEPIFSLLVAKEYASVSNLLPLMVLAAGLWAAASFSTILLHAERSTSFLLVPKNVSNGLGIVLTLLGAFWHGMLGVIIAKIIYSIVHLLWITAIVRRHSACLRATVPRDE